MVVALSLLLVIFAFIIFALIIFTLVFIVEIHCSLWISVVDVIVGNVTIIALIDLLLKVVLKVAVVVVVVVVAVVTVVVEVHCICVNLIQQWLWVMGWNWMLISK